MVEADAAGDGPLAGDVPDQLAECGLVPIDALLIGEPDRVAVDAGEAQALRQAPRTVGVGRVLVAGYGVLLPDLVHLTLGEQAENSLDRQVLRRAEPQLVAPLRVVAVSGNELLRIGNERARRETRRRCAAAVGADSVCFRVVVTGLSQPVASRAEELVVEVAVVAVVADGVLVAVEPAAGIRKVEVADLAFDRQRALGEIVVLPFRTVVHQVEVAHRRVESEYAVRALMLADELRRDGPVVAEFQQQRRATALGSDSVVLVVEEARIADRRPRGRKRPDAIDDPGSQIGPRDVMNVARV